MIKKVCIVSGGSSGLGLEIAKQLLKCGKNVIILGRNGERLPEAVNLLRENCSNSFINPFICNVGKESDVKDLGSYLTSGGYVTEFLFNNAGRGLIARAEISNETMVDEIFESNLKGMILLTAEILRITPADAELTIVNIMSTSALTGRTDETIYCAAKWGARGYTEALRSELKGTKRNIVAVYPGGMKTNFWETADKTRNISGFMDPRNVAEKIINAVTGTDKLTVTEITINRK